MLRVDLIHRDECYKIVGILYKVYKELGGDLLEKHYQKAVAIALKEAGIKNTEQFPVKLYYNNEFIGIYFVDFLVELNSAKIVLEIKKHENYGLKNIKQVSEYLKSLNLELGILANFTKTGVKYKRIVNLKK